MYVGRKEEINHKIRKEKRRENMFCQMKVLSIAHEIFQNAINIGILFFFLFWVILGVWAAMANGSRKRGFKILIKFYLCLFYQKHQERGTKKRGKKMFVYFFVPFFSLTTFLANQTLKPKSDWLILPIKSGKKIQFFLHFTLKGALCKRAFLAFWSAFATLKESFCTMWLNLLNFYSNPFLNVNT